jgi:hypothetical protein
MQALGIILQILGYVGMILLLKKFGFATSLDEYKSVNHKFLKLNGYQFWFVSWGLVIVGTILTLF